MSLALPRREIGAVQLQRSRHAVRHAVDRAQRPIRILKDHRHPRGISESFPARRHRRERAPVIGDVTARRLVDPRKQSRHGALAAPALPHERDDLVGPDRQVDGVHRVQEVARKRAADAEVSSEPSGLDDRLRRHRRWHLGALSRHRHTGDSAPALPRARGSGARSSCSGASRSGTAGGSGSRTADRRGLAGCPGFPAAADAPL